MTSGDSAAPPFDASLTVSAPAKVNLILRVLDRRADGYHNLWSVMHTVELEDEVGLAVQRTTAPAMAPASCPN